MALACGTVLVLGTACGTVAGSGVGANAPQTVTHGTGGHHHSHPGHTGKTVAYAGTIASVTGQHVSLLTTTHHTISLVLTPATKVLSQGAGSTPTPAQSSSLVAGQRIRAQARAGAAGLTAIRITLLGAPHVGATLRGTVAAVSPSSLTLHTASGKQVVLTLSSGVRVEIVPKSGAATASTIGAVKAGASVTIHTTRSNSGQVANLIRIHTG